MEVMMRISVLRFLVCFILLCVIFRGGSCCKHGWLRYGERCFRIYTETLTRFMGRRNCISKGSDLTSIPDESVLQYLNAQLEQFLVRGDRFWVGLQYDHDDGKLSWLDGTSAMEEPWIKLSLEGTSRNTSARTDCFAYNGTLIAKMSCSQRLGYICGHKKANRAKRTICNSRVDPKHFFIGEETGRCLFRASEKTTRSKVEALCAQHEGHFVDLDDMMKDGMTTFSHHKVFANDGSKYWTSLTWIGATIIWSFPLPQDLSIVFINGTGSCITVQFNFTEVKKVQLYQRDCDSEAQVMCWKTQETRQDFIASDMLLDDSPMLLNDSPMLLNDSPMLLNDSPMLSCPSPSKWNAWKEDARTGYCYWESYGDVSPLPWADAEQYCQSYGGHLPSLHSIEDEKFALRSEYGSNWIGLKLDLETYTYKWSDGTTLDYTNWALGHPDHKHGSLRCVAIVDNKKKKHWVSRLCGSVSTFTCTAPKQVNPPDPHLPTPLQPCEGPPQVEESTKSFFFEGSCYFAVSKSYSWQKAKEFCENEGAALVSIHSDREVGFLLRLLSETKMHTTYVWIGLTASDGSFRWTDCSPVDVTYFNEDGLNNLPNEEKCYTMDHDYGLWGIENCKEDRTFFCKLRKDSFSTITIPCSPDSTIGDCKTGWIFYHDRCYYLGGKHENDRLNWKDAEEKCVAEGGYLTSIRDEKDQGFLSYMVQSLDGEAWIGLRSSTQINNYKWLDNVDNQYKNWAPDQTSVSKIEEDCVRMVYNTEDRGVWRTENCERRMGYICYAEKGVSSGLVAIIVGVVIVLLFIVAAVAYVFYKRSAGKINVRRPCGPQSHSIENALYSEEPATI